MHRMPLLQALRKAQEDPKRFAYLPPAQQKAIRSILSEFETMFSVREEKRLSAFFLTEDLGAVLGMLFVLETLGDLEGANERIASMQLLTAKAQKSLKIHLENQKFIREAFPHMKVHNGNRNRT